MKERFKKILSYIPGFRTKKKWKMCCAVIGYIILLFLFYCMGPSSDCVTAQDQAISQTVNRLFYLVFIGIPFLLLTDAFQISSRVKFFSRHKIIYFLVVVPFIWVICTVAIVTQSTNLETGYSAEYQAILKEKAELAAAEAAEKEKQKAAEKAEKEKQKAAEKAEKEKQRAIEEAEKQKEEAEKLAKKEKEEATKLIEKEKAEEAAAAKQSEKEKARAAALAEKQRVEAKKKKEKIDRLLDKYLDNPKESNAKKVKKYTAVEVYPVISKKIKGIYTQDKTFSSYETEEKIEDLCNLYITNYPNDMNTPHFKAYLESCQAYTANKDMLWELDKKYGGDITNTYSNCQYREFYVIQKLGNYYEDTISGKIRKEWDSLKKEKPEYLAANVSYNSFWGTMPDTSTYYVLRPLAPLSSSGVYTAYVKTSGTKTLRDNAGFEFESTVYKEIDANALESDMETYNNLDFEQGQLEGRLENQLK